MMHHRVFLAALFLLGLSACERRVERIPVPACQPVAANPAGSNRAGPEEDREPWWVADTPKERFAGGKQAFEAVRDAILANYHAEGISEDDLYRAATRGLLENVDPSMRKWNKLLSPGSAGRLSDDLRGQIVGIGVRVRVDAPTGRAEVASVVPGTPAARAGLLAGDLLVSVDGRLCSGGTTREALEHLRGPVGEKIGISILRGDKLIPITVERQVILVDDVSHQVYPGGVGYVAVHSFSHRTHENLKAAMRQVSSSQPKGLVLDLRDNMGGGFDAAVAVAEQFIASGEPMIVVERRGGKKETLSSKGMPLMGSLPMVVLVNHDTSAAAEVIAAGLKEQRHARIVGMTTLGKWNIQDMHALPNGYAYKFTTAVLRTPSGRSYEGIGLSPDVQVDMTDDQTAHARDVQDVTERMAADPQLRTAIGMLQSAP